MMSWTLPRFTVQSETNQKFLYYGPKKTLALSADIKFESDTVYDDYRLSLVHATGGRLIINSKKIEWKDTTKGKGKVVAQIQADFPPLITNT